MQLLKIRLSGYRRFESESSVVLEHRVNAIVGRNESGKSSFLEALLDLNTDGPLDERRRTRDSGERLAISARFYLDDQDREALAEVPEAKATRWLVVERTLDGRSITLDPRPHRDLVKLTEAASAVEEARRADLLDNLVQLDGEESEGLVDRVVGELRAGETSDVDGWRRLASAINASFRSEDEEDDEGAGEGQATRAASLLLAAADTYMGEDPNDVATEILSRRVPQFLLFSEEDRDLRSEYQLLERRAADEPDAEGSVAETQLVWTRVPVALENLARLADLDLDLLREEVSGGHQDKAQTRIRRSNRELQARLNEGWGQASVECELSLEDVSLRIFVQSEGSDALFYLADRSAGFRSFVALQAFVAERAHPRPILLIDEVETHLHYDAQVDFVEVLIEQKAAGQAVYTTHSIGALPPDLISGVSAIVPIAGSARSTIVGNIWSNGPELGLTPLLAGMGARLLGFVVPTEVVLTEGSSDSILLPRLLRDAVDAPVSYRFSPGLASTTEAVVRTIHAQAARFACVVDGDAGGAALAAKLETWGIEPRLVVSIGDTSGMGAETVEDFLSAEALAAGVNDHLQRWRETVGDPLTPDSISPTGKWRQVEVYCGALGVTPPSKPQLAQTVLDLVDEGKVPALVDPRLLGGLSTLHAVLDALLSSV